MERSGGDAKTSELEAELASALEYQAATSSILEVISNSPSDVEPVFNEVLKTAQKLCGAERGAIWLLREDRIAVAAHISMDADHVEFLKQNPFPIGDQSVTGLAIQEGTVQHLSLIHI